MAEDANKHPKRQSKPDAKRHHSMRADLNLVLCHFQLEPRQKEVQKPSDRFLDGFMISVNRDLRIRGSLVGCIYPGKVFYLTRASSFVKFLRIAFFANV